MSDDPTAVPPGALDRPAAQPPSARTDALEGNVAWAGAGALGRGYRAGGPSARAVVDTLLARIERLNPALNALALVMADEARAQAATADRELAAGIDRGPLHGVPVAVKDLMAVAGWPTRFGSTVAPVARAEADAAVVARLREAGAVLLGKTTLLEYAYGAVHPEVGPTWNPWNTARTAGGSSGGSAAALAAGLVPLALGTDTGGSIRIPAAYCGVVGLKPTFGRLPLDGVFPLSWSLDAVGPMARDCADALALLHALDGASHEGEGSRERGHQGSDADVPAALRGARLGVPEAYLARASVEPGVERAFRAALEAAANAGARIRTIDFTAFAAANEALVDLLLPEASVIHEQYIRELGPVEGPAEAPAGPGAPAYAAATRAQLLRGFAVPATAYVRALRLRSALRARFEALMSDLDALLMPSVGFVAPAEDPGVDDPAGALEMHFSGPFNLLGAPAVSVPIGLSEGLPVGLQVVTAHGRDVAALSYGAAFEVLAPLAARPPLSSEPGPR